MINVSEALCNAINELSSVLYIMIITRKCALTYIGVDCWYC